MARRSSTSARCRIISHPHTTSDLLYKNALADTSKTIFAGLIRVEPKAQHTDAYQKVRNLMLSDDAEAEFDARSGNPRRRGALHARRDFRAR